MNMNARELQLAMDNAAKTAKESTGKVQKVAEKLYIELAKVQRLTAFGVTYISPDMIDVNIEKEEVSTSEISPQHYRENDIMCQATYDANKAILNFINSRYERNQSDTRVMASIISYIKNNLDGFRTYAKTSKVTDEY